MWKGCCTGKSVRVSQVHFGRLQGYSGRKREGPFEMSAGVHRQLTLLRGSVGSRDFISSQCSPGRWSTALVSPESTAGCGDGTFPLCLHPGLLFRKDTRAASKLGWAPH